MSAQYPYRITDTFDILSGQVTPLPKLNGFNQYPRLITHMQLSADVTWNAAPAPASIAFYLTNSQQERQATFVLQGTLANATGLRYLYLLDYVPSEPLTVRQGDLLSFQWVAGAGFAGSFNAPFTVVTDFRNFAPDGVPPQKLYQG